MSFRFFGIVDSVDSYRMIHRKIDQKNANDGWCEVVQNNGVTVYGNKTFVDVTMRCHPEKINYWCNADSLLGCLLTTPKDYMSKRRCVDLNEADILTLLKSMIESNQKDLIVLICDMIHKFGFIVDKNMCCLVCDYLF